MLWAQPDPIWPQNCLGGGGERGLRVCLKVPVRDIYETDFVVQVGQSTMGLHVLVKAVW